MKNKIYNGMNKIKQILKSKFRSGLKTLPYIAIALLVGVTAVYAGSLTPPGAPSKTMKSLSDLYELINTGVNTPSTDFTTPGTVAPTMHSLGDTYDLLATKILNIDTTKILTGTTIFGKAGSAVAGTPAPTFATGDQTTYSCEALATDPTQPAVTLETICGYHSADGCSWSGSACTGGTKTPTDGYMTWYAGTASCLEKSDEGSSSWRLPTTPELVTHYFENNIDGNPPTGFANDVYWSDTTYQYPGVEFHAHYVNMNDGNTYNDGKSSPNRLVHCVH